MNAEEDRWLSHALFQILSNVTLGIGFGEMDKVVSSGFLFEPVQTFRLQGSWNSLLVFVDRWALLAV